MSDFTGNTFKITIFTYSVFGLFASSVCCISSIFCVWCRVVILRRHVVDGVLRGGVVTTFTPLFGLVPFSLMNNMRLSVQLLCQNPREFDPRHILFFFFFKLRNLLVTFRTLKHRAPHSPVQIPTSLSDVPLVRSS